MSVTRYSSAAVRLDGRIKHETEVLTDEQEQLVAKALTMVGLLPKHTKLSHKERNDEESARPPRT